MCHVALMMPVFGLAVFAVLPLPAAVPVYLVILGLSLLLYRSIYRAHRLAPTGPKGLAGSTAVISCRLGSRLLVRMNGEHWSADLVDASGRFRRIDRCPEADTGRLVRVVDRQGVRLRVVAVEDG